MALAALPGAESAADRFDRRVMLLTDQNRSAIGIAAFTDWMNVMSMQGATALRAEKLGDYADAVTGKRTPSGFVVDGCSHVASLG